MSNKQGLKVGDKVRITRRGYVGYVGQRGVDIYTHPEQEGYFLGSDDHEGVESIEKIGPPVEQFGPGDVVRPKGSKSLIALGDDGFINLGMGRTYRPYGAANSNSYTGYNRSLDSFTSENYEKVQLG